MMIVGPKLPGRRRSEGDQAAAPTFAVAFGGGGARGLAHIHVIEALDELGIRPVAIAGSSIGAIMGAGMAAGMSGSDIQDYARSILGRRAEVAAACGARGRAPSPKWCRAASASASSTSSAS